MTAALILAIEPDRWRASQLKAIARRIGAELRLTDSMGGALAALHEQTPDLILTPALLSARDDQALTDRLRGLGEAAAHIQTLTIPTLTEPSSAELSLSNTRMFAALKKGGVYGIIDHSAAPGSGTRDTETLHRIDEDVVKKEVLAAGFKLDAESDLLRNPDDKRDWNSSPREAGERRGTSDRFMLRFVKP